MREIHQIGMMVTMECWLANGPPHKAVRVGRLRVGDQLVRVPNPFSVSVHERRLVRIPDADVDAAGGYTALSRMRGEQLARWCPPPDPQHPDATWYPRALFHRTQFDTPDGEIHDGEFYRTATKLVWYDGEIQEAALEDVEVRGTGDAVTIERVAHGRRS